MGAKDLGFEAELSLILENQIGLTYRCLPFEHRFAYSNLIFQKVRPERCLDQLLS
jgi:hypothetical protein